jgi:hypothetical protein
MEANLYLPDAMYRGDQRNREHLLAAVGDHPFDVIIDDGGHQMSMQIASLKVLFPTLPPGGIYIIEDMHFSHFDSDLGVGVTTDRFLHEVILVLHAVGVPIQPAIKDNILEGVFDIAKLTLSVTCFREVCVLERNSVVA